MIRPYIKKWSSKFIIIFGIFSGMDDIGNLVYILVFIIWFLYRAFSKGGKKPVKPASPPGQGRPHPGPARESGPSQSTPPPVTFEDILRELTGAPPQTIERAPEVVEEIPETYSTEYYPEPEEETAFEVLEPAPETPATTLHTGSSRFKVFEVKKKRSSKSARQALKMFKSKQGVRQAFIMKEIFDRKY